MDALVIPFLRWVAFVPLLMAAPAIGKSVSTGHVSTKPLGFVAGPATGTNIRIAQDIAEVARAAGIAIEVRPTLGSIDNLHRMGTRTENAGLGLVQSDVLGFLKRSQSAESQSIASKVRLVSPLYQEEVHLLASRNVSSISDLAGKRVAIGTEGSGSMLTAMNLFGQMGIKPAKLYKIAGPEAAMAVLTGQADAAVIVGGAPLKLFQNMAEMARDPKSAEAQALAQVHFLTLDPAALAEGYEAATLSKNDYPFLDRDVPTVAVWALLVVYDFTLKNEPYYHQRCAELGRLGEALRKRGNADNKAHPKWEEALSSLHQGQAQGGWPQDACLSPKLIAPRMAAMKPAAAPRTPAPVAADLSLHAPKIDAPTARLQNDLIGQLK